MIVIDASTLILLAKTELLDLFIENIPDNVVISKIVQKESTRKKSFDALLIEERIKEKKILIKKPRNKKLIEKISIDFNLHLGEAETLALCIENNWNLAGTDDFNAIKACIVLHIRYISSLGILLKLNEEKKVNKEEALMKLDDLNFFGRYSKQIIEDVKNKLR